MGECIVLEIGVVLDECCVVGCGDECHVNENILSGDIWFVNESFGVSEFCLCSGREWLLLSSDEWLLVAVIVKR